jgi:hypothetical protein
VHLTTNVRRADALAFYASLGFDVTHQGLKLYLQGDVTGRLGRRRCRLRRPVRLRAASLALVLARPPARIPTSPGRGEVRRRVDAR